VSRLNLPCFEARQNDVQSSAGADSCSSIESSEKTHSQPALPWLTRYTYEELTNDWTSALSQQTIQFRLVEEALVEVTEPPPGACSGSPMRIAVDIEEVKKRSGQRYPSPLEIEARNVTEVRDPI